MKWFKIVNFIVKKITIIPRIIAVRILTLIDLLGKKTIATTTIEHIAKIINTPSIRSAITSVPRTLPESPPNCSKPIYNPNSRREIISKKVKTIFIIFLVLSYIKNQVICI